MVKLDEGGDVLCAEHSMPEFPKQSRVNRAEFYAMFRQSPLEELMKTASHVCCAPGDERVYMTCRFHM